MSAAHMTPAAAVAPAATVAVPPASRATTSALPPASQASMASASTHASLAAATRALTARARGTSSSSSSPAPNLSSSSSLSSTTPSSASAPTSLHSRGGILRSRRSSSAPSERDRLRSAATDSGSGGGSGGSSGSSGDGGGGGGEGGGGGGEGAAGGSGLVVLWNRYLHALDTNPLRTKALTSLVLSALGDLLCQTYIERHGQLDVKRLAVTSTLGFVLVGPTLHFWYGSLSRLVPFGGTAGTLARLFLDQAVFSPVFISVFISSLLTLEGRPREIVPKLKQDLREAVVTNWKLWIPFQFLNFRFVPLRLQVAASNIVAIAWNMYLSLASHRKVAVPSQSS